MGVGKGEEGAKVTPWILKILAKKRCFLDFEWENQISPLLAPLWKNIEKPLSAPSPLGKNPSDAHEAYAK